MATTVTLSDGKELRIKGELDHVANQVNGSKLRLVQLEYDDGEGVEPRFGWFNPDHIARMRATPAPQKHEDY